MISSEQQPEQEMDYQPSSFGVPPIPENPNNDFFKYRISGDDIIDEIIHQLKGEVFDEEKKEYTQKFKPWANETGINKITYIVYSCGVNKNIFLGNLTREEILFKCKMIKKKLAILLFRKWHEFNIQKEMRSLLITTVINTIHSALSRSEGGRESSLISTATQRHEVFNHNLHNQKDSGFRMPLFSGRRY